jgi:xylulose-5-phosphate/fructose-6-phosphate phosphoketolase
LKNLDNDLAASMEWALAEIKKIQKAARSGNPIVKPRWPMIVLRTPKGLGGPKKVNGVIIEGSFHSHQVPLPAAKTSEIELDALRDWLKSYNVQELLEDGKPNAEVLSVIPEEPTKRLGQRKETYDNFQPLNLPEWQQFAVEKGSEQSCMLTIGKLLAQVVKECVLLLFSYHVCR